MITHIGSFFTSPLKIINTTTAQICQPLFSLQTGGAKKKAIKKETPRIISRSAEREEGYAPSTAPPFEKGGRKPLRILKVLIPLSAIRIRYDHSYRIFFHLSAQNHQHDNATNAVPSFASDTSAA